MSAIDETKAAGTLKAGDKLGRFELDRQLGEGAMAVVWLAHDPLLERRVAIKVLRREARHDTQYVERFLEDARAAARLNHPNIVRVVDVDASAECPFIIMDVVDGMSLDKWLEDKGQIDVARAAQLGRDIALALAAAHAGGVVHRDIKPSNVLIDLKTDRAMLSDFGAAKRERLTDTELTTHGQLIGTPRYMAPEQINGEPVAPQTDLFALGASLFEMLAGRPAFNARNRELLFRAILLDPTPDLVALRPETPAGLVALVNELLARPIDERPASATAVAERLAAYVDWRPGDPDPAAPAQAPATAAPSAPAAGAAAKQPADAGGAKVPPKAPEPKTPRDHPTSDAVAKSGSSGTIVKLLAGVALLAIVGAAGWWLMQPNERTPEPAVADAPATPAPDTPPEGTSPEDGALPDDTAGDDDSEAVEDVPPPQDVATSDQPPAAEQAEPEEPPAAPAPSETGTQVGSTSDGTAIAPVARPETSEGDAVERPSGARQLSCDDGPGCLAAAAVLDALDGRTGGLRIITNSENGTWYDGDYITVDVTAPADRGGYLQLDVLTDAGEAYHLLPEIMTPEHRIEPGETLRIGVEEAERRDGVRHWQASPPFGPAYLVATLTDKPLHDASRDVAEPLDGYMDDLLSWLNAADGASVGVSPVAFRPRGG
ncbi:MAG: protein kinase [Geminicoccaceae bacterium]|nr:protein kinase [Geminicoccaceae bacterium]